MDLLLTPKRIPNKFIHKVTLTRLLDFFLTENMSPNELTVYLISVLLFKYSSKLKTMKNEQNIIFLQNLPTETWGEEDIILLVSEAVAIKTLFNIDSR
jgi:hypothetical protein